MLEPIVIKSFKHNKVLHRSWYNIFLVSETDDYYLCISNKSEVMEDNGRKWYSKEPCLFYLFKKEWYNVCVMLQKRQVEYYVNLASPSILEDGVIKYIDYDLDLKIEGDKEIKLLDINEYHANSLLMNYDFGIDRILNETVRHVKNLIENFNTPFNDSLNEKIYLDFLKEFNFK